MDEHEAITRLKNKDISGLKALVEAYQLKAVRTATLITRDTALAEDVVQAAFIRVYKKIHQFDASRPFAPWFMTIVANAALKAAKQQQRTISLESHQAVDFSGWLPDSGLTPDKAMAASEQRQMIQDALNHLTPEQRAAVVMRYYLDMSERDMAERLGTPAGTIKWRLHEARKRLRGILKRVMQPGKWEV